MAYRLNFETNLRIVATETTIKTVAERQGGRVLPDALTGKPDENRHAAYDAVVRADPYAGFVLLRNGPEPQPELVKVAPVLDRAGYARTLVDGFAVYRPERR